MNNFHITYHLNIHISYFMYQCRKRICENQIFTNFLRKLLEYFYCLFIFLNIIKSKIVISKNLEKLENDN